ncbi:hypothetical protein OIO90_003264 [Microbotryomycetes sp. JL221]|nr:hypothetical protein OIO90_003264 [Microbotryomycetes sp. JL221]
MGLADVLSSGGLGAQQRKPALHQAFDAELLTKLPTELLLTITKYTLQAKLQPIDVDATDLLEAPQASVERQLAILSRTKLFHPIAQHMLYDNVHIGTAYRADKVLQAISEYPQTQNSPPDSTGKHRHRLRSVTKLHIIVCPHARD